MSERQRARAGSVGWDEHSEDATPSAPADVDEGGDPVCWANRVCPACGRLADVEPPTNCAVCGTEIPGPDD